MRKIINIMYLSKRDLLQNGKDFELARDLLKAAAVSSKKLILRHAETTLDSSTELLNEIATTDMAVGDVTTEIMATTLGKIPHEMFYMEDTTLTAKYASQAHETTTVSLNSTSLPSKSGSGLSTSSVVLCILLTALLIILLLCCITACMIARTRRKRQLYEKHGMECEPGCGGISQPLLGMEKTSNVTSKSSSQRY